MWSKFFFEEFRDINRDEEDNSFQQFRDEK